MVNQTSFLSIQVNNVSMIISGLIILDAPVMNYNYKIVNIIVNYIFEIKLAWGNHDCNP